MSSPAKRPGRWALKPLATLLLCSTALLSVPGEARRRAPDAERPNIVLILADDLGYGDIGSYGQTKIKTPNLDVLAQEGVRFTQFYAGNPVCAPSRAALLTGHDSGRGQIRGNLPMGGDFTDAGERGQLPLKAGTPTLSETLRSAGYRTAAIGKWGLGGAGTEGEPTRHGFDYFFGYLDQMQAHNYYPTHLWEGQGGVEHKVSLGNRFFIPHPALNHTSTAPADYKLYQGRDYAPDRLLAKAVSFIGAGGSDKPFFLYYAPTLTHAAMQVPNALVAGYKGRFPETPTNGEGYSPHPTPRAARAAMITRLDHEVGRLRLALASKGLTRRTLVIFCSDNGPSSEGGEDIAFFNASGGLRGQKRDVYEGGIRSPLIAYWPGHVAGGRSVGTIAASWDLLPTLAAFAGAALPATLDGHSFRQSLEGRPIAQTEPLYWEFHGDNRSAQAVRDGRWKAIRFQPAGFDSNRPIQLYDLATDPHEASDVSAAHPDIVAQLKHRLDGRIPSDVPSFNFAPSKGGE